MGDEQKPIVLHQLLNDDLDDKEFQWKPLREGVDISLIFEQGETGARSALLRYQPGASVPAHQHPGYEHIFVLSGEQQDESGVYRKGSLLIHPPGTQHSVFSDPGCLVLAVWQKPVKFL